MNGIYRIEHLDAEHVRLTPVASPQVQGVEAVDRFTPEIVDAGSGPYVHMRDDPAGAWVSYRQHARIATPQRAPGVEWQRDVLALLDDLLTDRTVRLRFSDDAIARIERIKQAALASGPSGVDGGAT